jgi:hypothetical protein
MFHGVTTRPPPIKRHKRLTRPYRTNLQPNPKIFLEGHNPSNTSLQRNDTNGPTIMWNRRSNI